MSRWSGERGNARPVARASFAAPRPSLPSLSARALSPRSRPQRLAFGPSTRLAPAPEAGASGTGRVASRAHKNETRHGGQREEARLSRPLTRTRASRAPPQRPWRSMGQLTVGEVGGRGGGSKRRAGAEYLSRPTVRAAPAPAPKIAPTPARFPPACTSPAPHACRVVAGKEAGRGGRGEGTEKGKKNTRQQAPAERCNAPPQTRPADTSHHPPSWANMTTLMDFCVGGGGGAGRQNVGTCAPPGPPRFPDGRGPRARPPLPPRPTPAATPPRHRQQTSLKPAHWWRRGGQPPPARASCRASVTGRRGRAGVSPSASLCPPSPPHSHLGEPLKHGAAPDRAAAGHDAAAAGRGRRTRAGAQAAPRAQRGARGRHRGRAAHRAAGRERAAGAGTQQHVGGGGGVGLGRDEGGGGSRRDGRQRGPRCVCACERLSHSQVSEFVVPLCPHPRQNLAAPPTSTECVSTHHHHTTRTHAPRSRGDTHPFRTHNPSCPCCPRRPPAPRWPRPPAPRHAPHHAPTQCRHCVRGRRPARWRVDAGA